MHRELRRLLDLAHGESRFIVAVFVDIRGFSSFARMAESSEAAVFLRRTYLTIIDKYFPQATYFKPTGDGLMIILDYDAQTLSEVCKEAVFSALQLVERFPTISEGDDMINFEVPHNLGVGIARGAATAIRSGKKTLDYSGRPLNLAARLMDLARPRGVVVESSIASVLGDEIEPLEQTAVFVRGIAESTPILVAHSIEVEVHERYRTPIRSPEWVVDTEELLLRDAAERGTYLHRLRHWPYDQSEIVLQVGHPKVMPNGEPHSAMWTLPKFNAKFRDDAGQPTLVVTYPRIVKSLRERGVGDDWALKIQIKYRKAPL